MQCTLDAVQMSLIQSVVLFFMRLLAKGQIDTKRMRMISLPRRRVRLAPKVLPEDNECSP